MTTDSNLVEVLRSVDAILFDFDGPLCDVFAGLPAWQVAQQLQGMAGTQHDTDDPLEILRRVSEAGMDGVNEIEDTLIAAEVAAVVKSTALPEGVRALELALAQGLKVGIVSNNSADAVAVFLEHLDLTNSVNPVVGRSYRHPELMKPHPWPMQQALLALEVESSQAVYIGDSTTDIEVAGLVNMPCIAYANKPAKLATFTATSAIVVQTMQAVVDALSSRDRATDGETNG